VVARDLYHLQFDPVFGEDELPTAAKLAIPVGVQRGHFPVDRLIREYPFDDIGRAVVDVVTGTAVKPVLMMR